MSFEIKVNKNIGFRFCIGQKFKVNNKVYMVESLTFKDQKVTMVGFTDGEKKYQKTESELIKQAENKVIIPV